MKMLTPARVAEMVGNAEQMVGTVDWCKSTRDSVLALAFECDNLRDELNATKAKLTELHREHAKTLKWSVQAIDKLELNQEEIARAREILKSCVDAYAGPAFGPASSVRIKVFGEAREYLAALVPK